MRIIGITGGIGTGKSTILNLLKEKYHAYIVEADKLAHQLMQPGQEAYIQIVEHFGEEILDEKGYINRKQLGEIVFKQRECLEELNAIVHPAVKTYIKKDIEEKKESNIELYVIEAALLIEDGYKAICDEIWYIYVEKEERIRRLILGRGENRQKWEQIIKQQSSEEFYRKYCDTVIDNGKSMEITAEIVKEILSKSQVCGRLEHSYG